MVQIKSVRQPIAAPQEPILGGALRGLAGSLAQGTARRDAAAESEGKYLANYLTAMAQQGRTPTSGQPSWLEGVGFTDAPVDSTQALNAQKLADLQNMTPQQRMQQKVFPALASALNPTEILPYVNQMSENPLFMPKPQKYGEVLNPQVGQAYFQKYKDPLSAHKAAKADGWVVPLKPQSKGQVIDESTVDIYLFEAGGDPVKARRMAQKDGWTIQ